MQSSVQLTPHADPRPSRQHSQSQRSAPWFPASLVAALCVGCFVTEARALPSIDPNEGADASASVADKRYRFDLVRSAKAAGANCLAQASAEALTA